MELTAGFIVENAKGVSVCARVRLHLWMVYRPFSVRLFSCKVESVAHTHKKRAMRVHAE